MDKTSAAGTRSRKRKVKSRRKQTPGGNPLAKQLFSGESEDGTPVAMLDTSSERRRVVRRRIESSDEEDHGPGKVTGGVVDALVASSKLRGMAPAYPPHKANPSPLAGKSSLVIAELAKRWLEELDESRVKSGYIQGIVSGDMKWRIQSLHEVVQIL